MDTCRNCFGRWSAGRRLAHVHSITGFFGDFGAPHMIAIVESFVSTSQTYDSCMPFWERRWSRTLGKSFVFLVIKLREENRKSRTHRLKERAVLVFCTRVNAGGGFFALQTCHHAPEVSGKDGGMDHRFRSPGRRRGRLAHIEFRIMLF